MINLVKHKSDSRKVIYNGYYMLLVGHINEIHNAQLDIVDAFLIDTDNEIYSKEIIQHIRNIEYIEISLLPVFIGSLYSLNDGLAIHIDGTVNINKPSTFIQYVITIKKRLDKLNIPKLSSHEELIEYKVLAYCYTRNKAIEPVTIRTNRIGYEYPLISLLYKENQMHEMLTKVDQMHLHKLINVSLKDYVHLCKSCQGNYINFRECCTKCDSIDIKAHDMVHHFVCAHVAPEKDFKTNDGLSCPKCDKTLRHIGIDYDKPSTIYSCNTCNHEFQNANMKGLCIDCDTEHELDELMERSINVITITAKGEQQLLSYEPEDSSSKQQVIGSVSVTLFKFLLKQEILRVKSTGCSSIFIKIHFQSNQLQLLNNDVKDALKEEISGIIKSYLKETDVLTAKSFNSYFMLFPETKLDKLARLENIQYNLSKLLNDNLEEEQSQIGVDYQLLEKDSQVHEFFE